MEKEHEEGLRNRSAVLRWMSAVVDVLHNDTVNPFHASWKSLFTQRIPLSLCMDVYVWWGGGE